MYDVYAGYSKAFVLSKDGVSLAIINWSFVQIFYKVIGGTYKLNETFPIQTDSRGACGSNTLSVIAVYYLRVIHIYHLTKGSYVNVQDFVYNSTTVIKIALHNTNTMAVCLTNGSAVIYENTASNVKFQWLQTINGGCEAVDITATNVIVAVNGSINVWARLAPTNEQEKKQEVTQ